VTASLPPEVQSVFDRFITTELTTIDARGQPITWPVTPYYRPGEPCIDVTTGLGYPKKAHDARSNPLVALLFSEPTESGLRDPPMVLVQGTAQVDDRDLGANRERYSRESLEKLPGTGRRGAPAAVRRLLGWYYTRIYIHVRPERVYVWPFGDISREPDLYGAHMEEVRSGHSEEPERYHADPAGGASSWDPRLAELGTRYPAAVLSIVSPDGFPFSVRVPVHVDEAARWIRIEGAPTEIPFAPGLACLTARSRTVNPDWHRDFQVRGDLFLAEGSWMLVPHRVLGGFELAASRLAMMRANARKASRIRWTAQRERARRETSSTPPAR
jgi:Pyridoxamine 5'-phosphate oxidase